MQWLKKKNVKKSAIKEIYIYIYLFIKKDINFDVTPNESQASESE